jgi:hypothetical protein
MAERSPRPATGATSQGEAPKTIQLIHVLVDRVEEQVSSKWGIHPQLKKELSAAEWQELSEHMNRVTAIVGAKFAEQLTSEEGNTSSQGTA